ncbi:MAG: TonB-dependent receptor [Maribacter sp.]
MKKVITKNGWNGLWIALFALLCAQMTQAQTISGTILDSQNDLPLAGASVVVKGTSIGVITGFDGTFTIAYDNATSAILVISYLGFTDKEIDLSQEENINNLQIRMDEKTTNLDEVVVSANLEGQQKALNQQRAADNIKNVVSTDLISRFPDLNVADALQRIPGINIQLDNGEGAQAFIRGTPANYTTVTINGEQIQNTGTSFDRTPQLYQFPVDQLGQIEVTKTITPAQDGDAIGGTIDLSTPVAKRPTWNIKTELGAGYNGLTKGESYRANLNFNRRFAVNEKNPNGAFGLLFSYSYNQTDQTQDETNSDWRTDDEFESNTGTDLWYNREHELVAVPQIRTRQGASFTSDYRFDNDNFIVAKFNYATIEEDEERQRKIFRPRDGDFISPTEFPDARIRQDFRDRVVTRYTASFNVDGNFNIGGYKLFGGYAYSGGDRDENGFDGRFEGRGIDLGIENLNSDYPIFFPLGGQPGDDFNPSDFDRFDRIRLLDRLVQSNASTAKINLQKSFNIGKSLLVLQAGYKNRINSSNANRNRRRFDFEGDDDVSLADFLGTGFVRDNWLRNEVPFGFEIVPGDVLGYFNNNRGQFVNNSEEDIIAKAEFDYEAEENTNAGYFMATLRTGKFNILAGIRNEDVKVDYSAQDVQVDDDGAIVNISPITGGNDYSVLLPNLQIKYELNNLTNFRAAYTRGYARPNFVNLLPRVNRNIIDLEASLGNPNLEVPTSNNFDLMFERYLGTVGIISGGAFYKQIDGFIWEQTFQDVVGNEFPRADQFVGYNEVVQPQNGEDATLFGIEANVQTNLAFISKSIRHFGIYFNYTYTDSEAIIEPGADENRLPGQAPHTLNSALTFDKGGFSARINMNYQDDTVEAIRSERIVPGDNNIIRDKRVQFDANASYTLKSGLRFFTELVNFTNAEQREYVGDPSRVSNFRDYGFQARFGVSFNL